MEEYCFGIVDENEAEVLAVERTIIANKPSHVQESKIRFRVFELNDDSSRLLPLLQRKIKDAILENSIVSLFIDYKIIVKKTMVEGSELFSQVHDLVPRFPAVLLTNVPDACYEKLYVDADKVYSKREFLKIEEQPSKEMVLNIFRNADHYQKNKNQLLATLKETMARYEAHEWSQETYEQIVKLDMMLDDYLPQRRSAAERRLKLDDLKQATALLREASALIGDRQ